MTNIGTLLAFVIVCAAVLIMRRIHPRPNAVPLPAGPGRAHLDARALLMFSLPAAKLVAAGHLPSIGLVIFLA